MNFGFHHSVAEGHQRAAGMSPINRDPGVLGLFSKAKTKECRSGIFDWTTAIDYYCVGAKDRLYQSSHASEFLLFVPRCEKRCGWWWKRGLGVRGSGNRVNHLALIAGH